MFARFLILGLAAAALVSGRSWADTLDDIRAHGHLVCAVNIDTDDYSDFDSHGDVSHFETGYCRALAAAILGDPKRATIKADGDEITGMQDVRDRRADLMIGATPDPALGLGLHLAFAPPIMIDGLSFLVSPRSRIDHVADIKPSSVVCYIGNTPEDGISHERLAELGLTYRPDEFSERGEMEGALATNHCDLITGDVTELANMRLALPGLNDFIILPETLTTDPLSPALRAGDDRLMAIVAAVDDGLLEAEAHGVTKANAATLAHTSSDPIIRRLVGAEPWLGPAIGLDRSWLLRALEAEGNHAEIYRRDVGAGSSLRLPVGANAPASDAPGASGGALVAPAVEIAR